MTTQTTTWRFSPVDTLFFRDSRPPDISGAAVLASLFPPSVRTVAGATRFLIGNALDVDWRAFGAASKQEGHEVGGVDLLRLMGRHDDYGTLRFQGPWLTVKVGSEWRRLLPAPRTLLVQDGGMPSRCVEIGPPVQCDLGRARLPSAGPKLRPAKNIWLEAGAYAQALSCRVPEQGVYLGSQLFREEPRLGIGRNLDRSTAEPRMLYQTRHVRTREHSSHRSADGRPQRLALELQVEGGEGLPLDVADLVKLGGEGRLSSVSIRAEPGPSLPAHSPTDESEGLCLALLSALPVENLTERWLPPGFERREVSGTTVWVGQLRGIRLVIHSAVLGKTQREGGWDLAQRAPRPVRSLLPAGSVYFATVHDGAGHRLKGRDLAPAIEALHLSQIAPNPLGYGQLAAGSFDSSIFPEVRSLELDPRQISTT